MCMPTYLTYYRFIVSEKTKCLPNVNKHVSEEPPGFCSLARTVDKEFCDRAFSTGSAVRYSHIVSEQTYLQPHFIMSPLHSYYNIISDIVIKSYQILLSS